ncbi:unnamed protein product [Staurois parvus]|uniref:Uncharacterized protein n=1 Tax=Staurois parvus TaxID=386267 RepID=A0ABN9G481_9NEOB|nr:unnamed protein product [Staurois parvus]
MQGPGRPDIVNAESGETRYSEMQGPGKADIVNAGSWESRYSECRAGSRQHMGTLAGGQSSSGKGGSKAKTFFI